MVQAPWILMVRIQNFFNGYEYLLKLLMILFSEFMEMMAG